MTDKTPSYALSGILVPRKFSTTLAADYASGTDYNEADRKPGAVTYSEGVPRLTLEASGSLSSTLTDAPTIQVVRSGMPGMDGAGFTYRYGDSGNWYGSDPVAVLTGCEIVEALSAAAPVQTAGDCRVFRLPDETLLAIYVVKTLVVSSYTWSVNAAIRALDGTWTSYQIATNTIGTSSASFHVGACIAPDGAFHVYWPQQTSLLVWKIALYRSEDGATWKRQAEDVAPSLSITSALSHIAAGTINGAVVLFAGDTDSQQLVSFDGGFTFDEVGSPENHVAVLDLETEAGFLHVLVGETTSALHCKAYRIATGSSVVWDTQSTTLAANGYQTGGALVSTPEGLLAFFKLDSNDTILGTPYRSTDSGSTWVGWYGPQSNSTVTDILANFGAVWNRGRLHLVGASVVASTASRIAGSDIVSIMLGGHSVVPLYPPAIGALHFAASTRRAFVPVESLADSGWTINDTGGSATRTLVDLGEQVTTGAGVTGVNEQSVTASTVSQGDCIVRVTVTSGTAVVVLESNPRTASVYVTPTQISIVNTGTTPIYVNHGITGAMELRICVDGTSEQARLWYRASDTAEERDWSGLAAVSLSASITGAAMRLKVLENSDVTWGLVTWRNAFQPPFTGTIAMDTTVGVDVNPCPIMATRRTYLGSGAYVRGMGGPAVYNGASYSVALGGSRYRKSNLLPQVAPSPRATWRSADTTTQTLKFTVDAEREQQTEWMEGTVALFLDGLVNVPGLTIKDSGATVQALDFKTGFTYSHNDGVVFPATTGATVSGEYVAEGALKGCQFEFANGQVRTIADNTEGVLTSGSTVGEKRARLRLEGLDGTEDASGAGYIWPSRVLVLWFQRGSRAVQQVQLVIESTVDADSRGYREIGTAALGEVSVFGRAFDRSTSNEFQAGVEIFQGLDGGTTAARNGPMQRTMEVAFVESPTFMGQVRAGGSPDYVRTSVHASSLPSATEYAVPLSAAGIYHRTEGGLLPVVPIRRIPQDPGTGNAVVAYGIAEGTLALGCFLGRINGAIRREQIAIGQSFVDDSERVATITFRECV